MFITRLVFRKYYRYIKFQKLNLRRKKKRRKKTLTKVVYCLMLKYVVHSNVGEKMAYLKLQILMQISQLTLKLLRYMITMVVLT